jgi:MFS transporter, FSR family, fosmidomycin resistance protein
LKLALLCLLGILNSGWYAVLQARLYDLIPDRSGIVLTIGSVTEGLAGGIPILLGILAEQFGVGAAMWLLLLGPLALLFGLPRASQRNPDTPGK